MPLPHPDIFLVAIGLIAGFIDSIAGGGGLIALPAMSLVVGPGLDAIGTNKIASLAAAGAAFLVYLWRGHVDWKTSVLFSITVAVGALAGSLAARLLPASAFPWFLAITCPLILYVVWNRDLWVARVATRERSLAIVALAGIAAGFYDGIWGPGGGTLMFLVLLFFARLPVLVALAASKLANTTAAAVALGTFGAAGYVHVREGLMLATGMLVGAVFGANLASASASRVVRPALLIVALLLVARVVASYMTNAGERIRNSVQLAMMNDLPGPIPMNDSVRLIVVTLAIGAVTLLLDRMARR